MARFTYTVGSLTDRGVIREENEDALVIDRKAQAFGVIDGMGGHAGGRLAAEIAQREIRQALKSSSGDAATRLRQAIAQANRAIREGRLENPQFSEMACVLTLLLLEEGRVTVAHIGDTRLYKIHGQTLQQITQDHSPVGELVRAGRLTEEEAMRHPNRNLVLRDVGSTPHAPGDPGWIDVYQCDFEPDAALLLASDGLCDQVPPADILALVRQQAAQPVKAAKTLVDRANRAGGKDNVSVILITGPQFARLHASRGEDSTERLGGGEGEEDGPGRQRKLLWIGLAAVLSLALAWFAFTRLTQTPTPPGPPAGTLIVDAFAPADATHFRTLQAALAAAAPGAVVEVRPGEYRGPFELRNGVSLRGGEGVTLAGAPELAAVVSATRLTDSTELTGVRIDARGAARGLDAHASTLVLRNVTFTGAREASLVLDEGASAEVEQNGFEISPGATGLLSTASTVTARGNRFVCLAAATTRAAEFRKSAGFYRVVYEGNLLTGCDAKRVLLDVPTPNTPPPTPAAPENKKADPKKKLEPKKKA